MMPQTQSQPAPTTRRTALPLWRIGDGAPPSGAFIGLVPGADAPLIALGLPASLKGVAREDVARRQAQDRLGGGGALDIRPARLGQGDGWTRVAVAARTDVLRWRASLGAGAARCRALVPDYAGLPTAPGLWTVENDGTMISARLGPTDGFSAEHVLANRLIAQALQTARATNTVPRGVLWIGPSDDALAIHFDGLSVVTDAADLPEALRPSVLAYGEAALDFARDPRADAEGVEARLRRMFWPALLLMIGAACWAGATALLVQRDQERAVAIGGETLTAARRDFLGTGPILDLRVQVARALDQRRGGSAEPEAPASDLDLLRTASEVLATTPTEIRAVALGRGQTGVVLELIVGDFRELDAVLAALHEGGLATEVTRSGIDPDGGVGATVSITEAAI